MTSFNLKCLFNVPIFKYSYWDLGLQHMNFGGGTIQYVNSYYSLMHLYKYYTVKRKCELCQIPERESSMYKHQNVPKIFLSPGFFSNILKLNRSFSSQIIVFWGRNIAQFIICKVRKVQSWSSSDPTLQAPLHSVTLKFDLNYSLWE